MTYICKNLQLLYILHMLNKQKTSTKHADYKSPLIYFHLDYYKDIVAGWAEELHLLNICIIYIKGEDNKVA